MPPPASVVSRHVHGRARLLQPGNRGGQQLVKHLSPLTAPHHQDRKRLRCRTERRDASLQLCSHGKTGTRDHATWKMGSRRLEIDADVCGDAREQRDRPPRYRVGLVQHNGNPQTPRRQHRSH